MFKEITGSTVALALTTGITLAGSPAVGAPANEAAKTIVLVHGAFADGSSWDRVVPLLAAKGYNVVAVHQPLTSLADDVAATKRVIEAQRGDVILVGHSYGGVVVTEAGNSPKVSALVYVAAFAPDAGESINGLGKGHPAPPWVGSLKIDSGGFASLPPEVVATSFAQDLTPAEARLLAVKQGPIFAKNFDDKVKTAAWHGRPTWYVRATADHMIDPGAQAFMAKRIGATTTSVDASHVLMLSKPKEVAAAILAAAATSSVAVAK